MKDLLLDISAFVHGYSSGRIARLVRNRAFCGKEVLASHHTGMGHRFADLVNAKRIADALGAKLVLEWPMNIHCAWHGIRPAEDVFSPDFVERHLVVGRRLSDYHLVRRRDVRVSDVRAFRRRDMKGMRIHRSSAVNLNWRNAPRLASCAEAFSAVPLSARLEAVRSYVRDSVRSFDVAIHIRRGDVYGGLSRLGGTYIGKAIPLPLVRAILERIGGDKAVLLVGDDRELIGQLSTESGATSVYDYSYLGTREKDKDDMFDICVLAKCKRVIGGSSAFVTTAAMIGASDFQSPEQVLTNDEMQSLLLGYIGSPASMRENPREVAGACQYASHLLGKSISSDERRLILRTASQADPESPEFLLGLTAMLLEDGLTDMAVELIERASLKSSAPSTMLALCELQNKEGIKALSHLSKHAGSMLSVGAWEVLEGRSALSPWLMFYVATKYLLVDQLDLAADLLAKAESALADQECFRMALGLLSQRRGALGHAPASEASV